LKVVDDVNIVADIIKKLFNSLAIPLINYSLYEVIVKSLPSMKCNMNHLALEEKN